MNGNVLSTKRTHVFQCNGYRLDKVFFISFLRLSGLMEYFNGTGNLLASHAGVLGELVPFRSAVFLKPLPDYVKDYNSSLGEVWRLLLLIG